MAVIDVSFYKDEQLVGIPNLEYLQLAVCVDIESHDAVLFDVDEARELIRISNTEDNRNLLRSFAYQLDSTARYHSEQAFENGRKEGYRKRSLEIKWALENLMKVPNE